MDNTHEHSHDEPTVDDLRVKLCYICREEEHHDSPSHPPTVWLHPCKCTLVAHQSCLLHWIKTQQREFGRSRGDLKCPQCGELYEFEGFNPRILRIFNSVNRSLSRSGRIVTFCCVGTVILSSGAGIYLACASYGAFAVREFVGPDLFRALLTSNPTNWPAHAWFYLPLIPFSLIVSRTPYILWTTSPLVPLLFPWPSTLPVSAVARGGGRVRLGLWPPPPALVCALFPVVRVLYRRLRDRLMNMVVQDIAPLDQAARLQLQLQQLQQRHQAVQGIQEQQQQQQQPRGNQQERQQHLRIHLQARGQQQQQPQQLRPGQRLQQMPEGPGAGRRFRVQVGELFGFEIAHFIWDRNPPPPGGPFAPARGPAAIAAGGDNVANGGDGGAVDNPADRQQQQPHQDGLVQEPEGGPPAVAPEDQDAQQEQLPHRDGPAQELEGDPPALAPADQDAQQEQQPRRDGLVEEPDLGPPALAPADQDAQQEQQPHRDGPVQEPERGPPALAPADQDAQQQQQQPAPEPEPQQQQRAGEAEPGQGQGQEPVPPAQDEEDPGAIAARVIRVTGASFGRIVGGALLMPSIARVMGSVLLRISHVVPLVRTIIAPLPPLPHSGPISGLFRLIGGAPAVRHGYVHGWLNGSGLGAVFLRGLFGTSQQWATSDPVWWRNTLGLGVFLVVKDGLKLFHLWLAKRELEERHIKNKSFAGVDLAELDLVERHKAGATD